LALGAAPAQVAGLSEFFGGRGEIALRLAAQAASQSNARRRCPVATAG
jgi:hypothetical protein